MADSFSVYCPECYREVWVTDYLMRARCTVESNGKRGKGFVPAHVVYAEVTLDDGGDLFLWECPACGYADSAYVSARLRREYGG